jgi:hypothetical protein
MQRRSGAGSAQRQHQKLAALQFPEIRTAADRLNGDSPEALSADSGRLTRKCPEMSDYDLYYWSGPFRGQFVRAALVSQVCAPG